MRDESLRLASLVEQNPDAVFCLDPDGVLTEVNPAGELISGYPRATLKGMHFAQLLDPDDIQHGTSLFVRVCKGETVAHENLRIRNAAGETIHLGVSAFPKMLEGKMVGLVGIGRDITRRVREREELRVSRQRYKSLIDSSPNAIVVHIDRRIIFVNGAACDLVGAQGPEDLVGREVMDFIPEEDREVVRARIREILEHGSAPVVEERLIALDGSLRHVEIGAACISFEDRPAIQLVIRDVSDIRRSESLLRQITENVHEVFYLAKLRPPALQYVSPAYEEIVGRPLESLFADPASWWETIHPSDLTRVKKLHETKKGREAYELEYRIIRPDGTIRWLHERNFPVRDEEGRAVSLAGIIEDVTERKLLEDQLFQSQKMESIGRLAGGVAHDFNNLLMVIANAARFVEEEIGPDSPARDDIEQVISAAERGAKLVRQLLTYSRKQLVAPKVVDVNDVIADMRDLVQRTIGEDIALLLNLHEGAWLTMIDPSQLSQILLNLAVNARDAMARGGTLALETRNTVVDEDFAVRHPEMEAGPYVTISVSDTGSGIPREIVDMIFEPFFSTKSKAEASGLGLSMVYGIVKQAGGNVSVYTEVGIGTTFNIYLKAADEDATVPDEVVFPTLRHGRGERVLVAEDDPAVLDATVRMLSRNGYEVIQASSGEKALEVIQKQPEPVDLLLADVVMPRMSGRELASHIRVVHPETKIIFMSGYTGDMIGRHGVLGDDENYIQKPFTAEELLRKISDVLQLNAGASPTSAAGRAIRTGHPHRS